MTDTFDPFTLESTFDPLGSEPLAPTGQSAYSRQDPPPPRQRRRPAPVPGEPAVSPSAEIGAGNRLAHLLRPGDQCAAGRQHAPGRGKATPDPEDVAARLLALEDNLAILTARLDSLHTAVTERLGDQRDRLVKAVAAMLDERLGPRR